MRAAIYARFSNTAQREESIDAQVRYCQDYASSNGISIVQVYSDEAISGKGSKTGSRKQYQKMLKDCQKGIFDTILIHKYDRVARSIGEHVNLEQKLMKHDIKLVATAQDFGSSNESKIMRTLMWAMSEYYIDNLAEEVKKGHRENALKGLHNGGKPPFGYDVVDRKYVINQEEAKWVRRIFQAAADHLGFTDIVRELELHGITGKRGRPIRYPQIYEILRNEKYTGVYTYTLSEEADRENRRTKPSAIRVDGAMPAIIEKGLFAEVQKVMDERKQVGKKMGYLCSGLVYCGCGEKMHAHKSDRKGHVYYYYKCSKKCGVPAVRMERVDEAANKYLHFLLSEHNQEIIIRALQEYEAKEARMNDDFASIKRKKIAEKQVQYDSLMKNLMSGALPESVASDVGKEMESLKLEIEALEEMEPPKDYTSETIAGWLESIKAAPDNKAVRLLIEKINIIDSGKKNKTDFNITSTLESVLGEIGCGRGI